jgi:hypothetical protein
VLPSLFVPAQVLALVILLYPHSGQLTLSTGLYGVEAAISDSRLTMCRVTVYGRETEGFFLGKDVGLYLSNDAFGAKIYIKVVIVWMRGTKVEAKM